MMKPWMVGTRPLAERRRERPPRPAPLGATALSVHRPTRTLGPCPRPRPPVSLARAGLAWFLGLNADGSGTHPRWRCPSRRSLEGMGPTRPRLAAVLVCDFVAVLITFMGMFARRCRRRKPSCARMAGTSRLRARRRGASRRKARALKAANTSGWLVITMLVLNLLLLGGDEGWACSPGDTTDDGACMASGTSHLGVIRDCGRMTDVGRAATIAPWARTWSSIGEASNPGPHGQAVWDPAHAAAHPAQAPGEDGGCGSL